MKVAVGIEDGLFPSVLGTGTFDPLCVISIVSVSGESSATPLWRVLTIRALLSGLSVLFSMAVAAGVEVADSYCCDGLYAILREDGTDAVSAGTVSPETDAF